MRQAVPGVGTDMRDFRGVAIRSAVALAVVLPTAAGHRPEAARGASTRADTTLVWFRGERLTNAGIAAVSALSRAGTDGLDPAWYDAGLLDSLARAGLTAPLPAAARADLDARLTASLRAFLLDLRYGRVRATPFGAADSSGTPEQIIASALDAALAADTIDRLIRALRPPFAEYEALRKALARYRAMETDEDVSLGHSRLPLHVGDSVPDGAVVRRRLALLGDLGMAATPDSAAYDSALARAVARFQARHGLDGDGVLGRETAAALAVPVAHRVRQLELALERIRWLPRDIGPRLVLVNIAVFRLRAFDSLPVGGAPVVDTRVVVGDARRTRTPMLHRELRSVDFHPYWNVPRSILVNEIIPRLRREPGYLRANDMEAVQGDEPNAVVVGDSVTPDLIQELTRGTLWVRQRPGPRNALGRVRFDIPNESSVYLHDTPQREAFTRARRDLSHGCVRVDQAAALATWVLRDRPGWSSDSVDRAMGAAEPRRVRVPVPIDVIIEYRTATVRPDGSLWFFPDIYGLDSALVREITGAGAGGGSTD